MRLVCRVSVAALSPRPPAPAGDMTVLSLRQIFPPTGRRVPFLFIGISSRLRRLAVQGVGVGLDGATYSTQFKTKRSLSQVSTNFRVHVCISGSPECASVMAVPRFPWKCSRLPESRYWKPTVCVLFRRIHPTVGVTFVWPKGFCPIEFPK